MDGTFDIEAIIGSDFLEQVGAVIDYPAKQIRFGS